MAVVWEPVPRHPDSLKAVALEIQAQDDWLIVTHERPDGDAIGSSLAMTHVLTLLGKKWTFLVAEPMPKRFSYLPLFSVATIAEAKAPERTFRHVIALDCADSQRYQQVAHYLDADAQVVNIDHHRTNPRYGIAAMVDDQAAATCELVFHVAHALDVPITKELATCLYTGILTDTGGFAQPNTTRAVHQIAAELLASGVQPYDIAEPAHESRTWEQMHLLQMALTNLTVSSDGKYAAIYVTRGMLEGAGADEDDVEGLVGFARSIDTVEVGMLFRELADGRVKVSLRSKHWVDVSKIAQLFGGGGHARAAGCMLGTNLGDAIDSVVEQVEIVLAEGR